ncbi:defective in cullin neddylation protein AAR3 isoform X2 [Prosopis cineraria]|uniref:defective in cullin neddylation protein AAR3 isoform X2 n=1 Tax=Prosopis cineraria TaxID=364024 RepID=UPI00240ECD1D|nr:defective in cullin neddylation protein AAR3 isoform X2 [Prosopis cineraria]
MDPLVSTRIDIFEIYRRYRDIKTGNTHHAEEGYRQDCDLQKARHSREALAQLLKLAESRVHIGVTIFDEFLMLMAKLDLTVDFSEFSCFYDFVFFMCRENGQKNITVSRAITAWKLVLAGRFPLLSQWCDFVEKNQRYNISEDTWQQLLAFSLCTQENLEGYDPEGAWPVLVDDFVDHMYRSSGSSYDNCNLQCNCGDPQSQSCIFEDLVPGMRNLSGLKRKVSHGIGEDDMEAIYTPISVAADLSPSKRSRGNIQGAMNSEENPVGDAIEDCNGIARNNSPLCSSKSPCAVERCLSKGFAGLLSTRSFV